MIGVKLYRKTLWTFLLKFTSEDDLFTDVGRGLGYDDMETRLRTRVLATKIPQTNGSC